MRVLTAGQMREIDELAIREIGIPSVVLMENAGRGAAEVIKKRYGLERKRILVLCGRGNNGGDGLVVARYLKNWGAEVKVCLLAEKESIKGDAELNLRIWTKIGGELIEIKEVQNIRWVKESIEWAHLIVDAILGTGAKKGLSPLFKEVIELVNSSRKPVVALDLPSGVDPTTGEVEETAIKADCTITFGMPKVGLVVYPGAAYVGDLEVVDIGIPKTLLEQKPGDHFLLDPYELYVKVLGPREKDTHKGTYGHLLVVAGSRGKTGAAAMVGEAALKIGAGLVTVAIPESLNPILEVKLTEVMTEPLPEEEGFLAKEALGKVLHLMEGKKALAVGPGLGVSEATRELIYGLLRESTIPMVFDADAINCLAGNLEPLKAKKAPLILTPHPGEMGRLVGMAPSEVKARKLELVRTLTRQYEVIVVLKGAGTIIGDPSGTVYINPTGNPGMASGGMGDVLTGLIGGLLAQGVEPLEAAKLGVYLHGLAGDLACEELGELSLVATDLLRFLPKAITRLKEWKSAL